MRSLVTGACGFVGGFLTQHLLKAGDEVIAGVLRKPLSELACKTVHLDVSNFKSCVSVISEFKPEVIYHLAGIAFVPEAEENFDRALVVNVGGTNNIFRACHLLEMRVGIVQISSAEAYGKIQSSDLPIREQVVLRPAQNYSLSKAMSEMVAQRYHQFGFARAVIMRPFNHIGPGQDERFVASNFAQQLARIARGRTLPQMMVGNLEARRDFSDVRDVVRAYRLAAERLLSKIMHENAQLGPPVYNIGSGSAVSVQHVLDTLITISGVSVKVERDSNRMRPSEVPEVYGSYEKARNDLGWSPEIKLTQSLKDVYQYWYDRV